MIIKNKISKIKTLKNTPILFVITNFAALYRRFLAETSFLRRKTIIFVDVIFTQNTSK